MYKEDTEEDKYLYLRWKSKSSVRVEGQLKQGVTKGVNDTDPNVFMGKVFIKEKQLAFCLK